MRRHKDRATTRLMRGGLRLVHRQLRLLLRVTEGAERTLARKSDRHARDRARTAGALREAAYLVAERFDDLTDRVDPRLWVERRRGEPER